MRCLIVDDSADFRDAATDMLERAGFDVVEQLHAEDGPAPSTILISTHSEQDYAEMIAASPALGFLAKFALSPAAIRGLLGH
jgi:CheY-like chemotaxis protein